MTSVLTAASLRRSFGEENAVDGIDLEVGTGEIHAIVGLNGAGKTTLIRLLLGMLRPDSGTAKVIGHDAVSAPADVWRRVGHLVETPFAYPELTVRDNLEASARLRGVTDPDEAAVSVISRFELGHWADRRAATLSSGNVQRLGLASALVHRPSVLVLDEPANALDPAGVVFIRELLQALASEGVGVLVSSHHLDQLARVAHSITVIHRGRVVGSLDPTGTDLEQRFFETVHRYDLQEAS